MNSIKQYRVLIAEDEGFIAKLYKSELEVKGVHATIVQNGKDAMHTLQKNTFDLVIIDLLMPVADGYQLLDFMKEKNIQTPRVVISNLNTVSESQYNVLGANMCICKSKLRAQDLWQALQQFFPEVC